MKENSDYLQSQLITYIGNKRSLLPFIEEGVKIVKSELKKDISDIKEEISNVQSFSKNIERIKDDFANVNSDDLL